MLDKKQIVDLLINLCLKKDRQCFDHIINHQYDATQLPGLLLKNGIAPLAYENLNSTGILRLFPLFFSQQLETYLRQSVLRNLQLRAVFETIGNALEQHHIQFVALKGIYLQYVLYDNPGVRPMVDIDILIPSNRLALARDIIIKMGGKEIFNDPSEFINSLRHQSFPILLKGITIELHRNIIDSFDNLVSVDQNLIFKECIPFKLGNISGLVLSNEFLLIHLCHHVFSTLQGGTAKLISYFDIHFLIEKRGNILDWNKIRELCAKSGAYHTVSKTLGLVEYLFGKQDIPEYFLTEKNYPDEYVQLLTSAVLHVKISTDNQYYLNKFSKINGFMNRAKYLTNRILPDIRYIKHKYNANKVHKIIAGYCKEIFEFVGSGAKAALTYIQKNQRKYNSTN